MNVIDSINNETIESLGGEKVTPRVGERVRVSNEISEGDKSRIQKFEGLVIAVKHGGIQTTFTVRKESMGVGVERIYPLYSPLVKNVEVLKRHKVRRSKLYFQRQLRGKAARLKEIRRRSK